MKKTIVLLKCSNKKLYISKVVLMCFIFLLSGLTLEAQNNILESSKGTKKISLTLKNTSLKNFFTEIEKQSDLRFFYDAVDVNENLPISANYKNTSINEILKETLSPIKLNYRIAGDQIIITPHSPQNKPSDKEVDLISISGIISDEKDEPIIGATVTVEGEPAGTITDVNGHYELQARKGAVLKVSSIGFESRTVRVGNQPVINIRLKEDSKLLEEVVVVGYGIQRKRDITGSIVRVDPKRMETMPNVNPVQALRGTVAGVQIIDDGRPGSSGTISIRGTSSITASNQPLIVLDGIPYMEGNLADINSNDIESIDILKDASSAAVYGARGTNGVILITTKRGSTSKPCLNYNGYYGFSKYASLPKLLGPEKYMQKLKDVEEYLGGQLTILNPLE